MRSGENRSEGKRIEVKRTEENGKEVKRTGVK